MFQIRVMEKNDFAFSVKLANTMNWQMTKEDFMFAKKLEPDGCFLLQDDGKPVGLATCVCYGKTGWFGNLIEEENYRKRGGGAALVDHAVKYLNKCGAQTVGLYAYQQLARFYGKLGFVSDAEFSLLSTKRLGQIVGEPLRKMEKTMYPAVAQLDLECFGGDRMRLLESVFEEENNLGCCFFEKDALVGFGAATVNVDAAWIGPIVCCKDRFDVAEILAKSMLSRMGGRSVYAVVPKTGELPLFFSKFGFAEEFSTSRMFLGKAAGQRCVYLAESLERG